VSYLFRYLRHSEEAKDQPNSREAQARAIQGWVDYQASRGITYLDAGEFYDPNVSGGDFFKTRTAGAVLAGRVQPGDVVVAAKWDRMFRDCIDGGLILREFNKKNVSVVCLDFNVDTRTAAGFMMAMNMLAFAEFERQRISERTKKGRSSCFYSQK
jgi:DNA invertase Pin-like site-specific DNA recombinase